MTELKPFVLNLTDLNFILSQLNFLPLFDEKGNAIIDWDGLGKVYDRHGSLLWDPSQTATFRYNGIVLTKENVLDTLGHSFPSTTSFVGLREISGIHNNLNGGLPGNSWGVVDHPFIRNVPADFAHYMMQPGADYTPGKNVIDSTPRMISQVITTGGVTPLLDDHGQVVFWDPARYQNDAAYRALITNWNTSHAVQQIDTAHQTEGEKIVASDGSSPLLDSYGNALVWHAGLYDSNPAYKAAIDDWNAAHKTDQIDISHLVEGAAVITGHGLVGELGQIDYQNPDSDEIFIGATNPGVAPVNGWFALFGQFFDHGLDFIDKNGAFGKISITLDPSDPLYRAPNTLYQGDPGNTAIKISRAAISGHDADGTPQYVNHTSPYIDQSQTYGSSEQITTLLREWVRDPNTGEYHAGTKLLDGNTLATAWKHADGTMGHNTLPTLAELNAHLRATGRAELTWDDVNNLRARDAHGQIMDGDAATAGTQAVKTGHALLLDMNPHFDTTRLSAATQAELHSIGIDPVNGTYSISDLSRIIDFASFQPRSMQLNFDPNAPAVPLSAALQAIAGHVLFDSVSDHYIAGDGRVNENFGLTAIHHVFHEEHNYQVENIKAALAKQDAGLVAKGDSTHTLLHGYQVAVTATDGATLAAGITVVNGHYVDAAGNYTTASGTISWDLDKMFNAAKLVVEMEYQHTAVDQYARTVTPDIPEFVGYNSGIDGTISLEYAQSAFRFGHSTLRETIDTIDPKQGLTGKIMSYALELAFLNPAGFAKVGPGAIALGMTHQQMAEIDEFVTPALNQGLLNQPLDLAAINIARGRDIGLPTLNDLRVALQFSAYGSWAAFGAAMLHPESLVNFIAAYSFNGAIDSAKEIIDLVQGKIANGSGAHGWTFAQALSFLNNTQSAGDTTRIAGADGFQHIDSWIGGLAERHILGGLLGETFNAIFVDQITRLMDGDRFYYLYRLVNQQFGDEIGNEQFKDIIERNTGVTHLNGSAFAYADKYYEMGADGDSKTAGLQNDLPNHKYGKLVSDNAAGIMTRGGLETSNGTVFTYSPVEMETESRRNFAFDGLHVNFQTRAAAALKFVLDQRAELNPSQRNLDDTPVSGADSSEVLVATDYTDVIYMGGGDDTAYGEGGDDIIYGEDGIDRLYGGAGDDIIHGGEGGDLIDGGDGDDILYGDRSGTAAAGTDQIIGSAGNDVIYGGLGIDKLSGGGGDDVIFGGGDTDPFTHGGDGNDYIDGGQSGDLLYGDNGDDVLVGGDDQDVLYGGNGDDILRPGNPSQSLAGFGPDEVLGGDGITDTGFDLIDFSDYNAGASRIIADLTRQANPTQAIDKTTPFPAMFQVEGVIGSQNADTEIGDAGNNWLIGGSGDDILTGGAGFDVLIGDHVRLDALIGSYSGTYTAYDDIEQASHRTTGKLQDNGLLGNSALGTGDFEKHFTSLLKSDMFRDYMLGNDGGKDGEDIAVYRGNRADYRIEAIRFTPPGASQPVTAYLVTGISNAGLNDGKDLLLGIETLRFADGDIYLGAVAPHLILHTVDVAHYADSFSNGYAGDPGQAGWVGGWQETSDPTANPTDTGAITVSNGQLRFGENGGDGASIQRTINLANATAATLSYTVSEQGLDAGETVKVYFSADGTEANFVLVDTIGKGDTGLHSFALTGNFTANAAIRFVTTAFNYGQNAEFATVDDVKFDVTRPANPVTSDYSATFTEDQTGATAITSGPSISDDGATLESATIVLRNALAGDELLTNGITGIGIVSVDSSVAGRITVTLKGHASLATYQAALAQISFRSSLAEPVTGDRIIEVTVSDGVKDSNTAITTIHVQNVNDAPTAVDDNVITNIQSGPVTISEALLIANDTDPDSSVLKITGATANGLNNLSLGANRSITFDSGTGAFNYTLSDGSLTDHAKVTVTRTGSATDSAINGSSKNDIIIGDGRDSQIDGGAGNDRIFAGAGNDTIIWNAGNTTDDGHDIIDGGAGTGDRVIINGSRADETFRVYARAAWLAIAGNLASAIDANSEIIITRNGTGAASIIAELRNVEEITINTGRGNDTVIPIGDFNPTSLAFNTITINGSDGNDVVDISRLASAHRIVFRSAGGSDTIIGALRPQDVIEVPSDPKAYHVTKNADGTSTLSNGQHSITYYGQTPQISASTPDTDDHTPAKTDDDPAPPTPPAPAPAPATDPAHKDGLVGTAGSDVLTGHEGDDTAIGGDGADIISGAGGRDILRGDGGDDVLMGGNDADVLTGGTGDDELHGGSGDDLLFGNEGNDLLFGDAGNDVVEGGAGSDRAWLGDGDDRVIASANDGDDTWYGDGGNDTLDYSAVSANLTIDLGNGYLGHGSVTSSATGTDTIYGFENVIGGAGHDTITASVAVNIMDGGLGDDRFVFTSAAAADGDTIYGFSAGDRIDFSAISAAITGGLHLSSKAALNAIGDVVVTHEVHDGHHVTLIHANTTGDSGAELTLTLDGDHNLTKADFIGVV